MTDDFITFDTSYIGNPLNEQMNAAIDYIFTSSYHVSWAVFYREFGVEKAQFFGFEEGS